MKVFVSYRRGSPQGMKVFKSIALARRYVAAQDWPRNYVIHARTVHTSEKGSL